MSVVTSPATADARVIEGNWRSVASSADGTKLVAVASGGKIYVSKNAGSTWTWSAREFNLDWRSVASSADGTKLVAVVNGGPIYVSSDSGNSWTAQAINGAWTGVASSADGTKLFATQWQGKKILNQKTLV